MVLDFVLFNVLLIVPYGIETNLRVEVLNGIELLIVPYGIETTDHARTISICISF